MSGDVSGGDKGQIKFHFSEFAQAPKIPGMKGGLAGAMLAEFEKILQAFKTSLDGIAKVGRELAKLATSLVSLAQALNTVTSTEEKPSEIVGQVEASIEAVKKDMAPFKKNTYYTVLIGALNRIAEMFKGGGLVAAVRQLSQDVEAMGKWLAKHEHGKFSKSEKKKFEDMLRAIQGDLDNLKELRKAWPTGILGPYPKALEEIALRAWVIYEDLKSGFDRKKVVGWIRQFVPIWEKKGKLDTNPDQIVRLLQAMAKDDTEGKKLRENLPGVWAAYDSALGAVREMQAQAASMSNTTISNIYSKMTAIQQLTKLLSKDLNVPITAIDQSITRVFR